MESCVTWWAGSPVTQLANAGTPGRWHGRPITGRVSLLWWHGRPIRRHVSLLRWHLQPIRARKDRKAQKRHIQPICFIVFLFGMYGPYGLIMLFLAFISLLLSAFKRHYCLHTIALRRGVRQFESTQWQYQKKKEGLPGAIAFTSTFTFTDNH